MKKHIYLLLSLFTTLMACEEVIDVALPNPEGQLIIEGEINTGMTAIVNLSRNMAYFDPIDSSAIADMFITDSSAIVVVSDGQIFDTLTVMPITRFPFVAYVGSRLIGEVGKSYSITIDYAGKHYYANTSIPTPIPINDIWFEKDYSNDNMGMIGFSINDPNENNYYAVSSLVIGKQWWYYQPVFGLPVFDDILFNGDSSIVVLPRGYAGNDFSAPELESEEAWDSLYYYFTGESVSLRLATIDENFYLWWNSLFRASFTGSNPYSNPSTILTNIEGDPAMGVWGGYANTIANFQISDSGIIEDLSIEDILPMTLPDSIMN